ncbi:PaaI family thioesterase [uncultured Tateyamaria sp.]|uniref:PaaI family thioesterase n=1 Tax=uncultured Tateyamaria sp. TaxID=455651 RepID=UPI002628F7A4|nr:PaaI family thioesterase [uncultured Tateyamaria sp.]
MAVVMTAPEMNAFLQKVFLEVAGEFHVEEVKEEGVVLRLLVHDRHLRPGGTISGPAMFGLADVTAYMVTLAHIGPRALAVTTNCAIDFMRKPKAGVDLIAHGRLLKLGKQLSVSDVLLFSEGDEKPVARASLTYAIPPQGVDLPQ